MITLWGEGRGFRVAWLLEEMGLAYRVRDVDLLAGVENDPEFLAINPGGFIPALQDGETIVVESVAIMQYLMGRHGPTPMALDPGDPAYGTWLQFLVMGEAGLMGPAFFGHFGQLFGDDPAQPDWTARQAMGIFESRRGLVARRLEKGPYLCGEAFTAADISVAYALQWAGRTGATTLTAAEQAYLDRATSRPAYDRAMDSCKATKAWVARAGGR
ncbi:MAG: glutathione S-transferase family protein [Caulobacter sp.]|nr:glutathione S-transferase family protein [Caulobacter sp.]